MGSNFFLDPDELLSHEIIVDKLDAARRQLESAVVMFFNDWDVVSQHTLISAAHGILYDLAKIQGVGGSIKDSFGATDTKKPTEKQKDFWASINYPQNFFKHADRDSGTKMVFRYNVSPFYLLDAVRLFTLLHGSFTDKMKVFLMWFQLRYPDKLCFPSIEENLKNIRESTINPEAFKALGRILLKDILPKDD